MDLRLDRADRARSCVAFRRHKMKNPFSLPAKRVALALAIFVCRPGPPRRRLQADSQIGAKEELTSAARPRQFSGASLALRRFCHCSRLTRSRPIFSRCCAMQVLAHLREDEVAQLGGNGRRVALEARHDRTGVEFAVRRRGSAPAGARRMRRRDRRRRDRSRRTGSTPGRARCSSTS